MADKTANEIVKPSCSNYEVTDTELITGKNRKRELSISESEFEYNDYTDISKCESSAIKNTPCKDNQSNAICKRISEQSLSDAIQKLTEQIEYIEKSVALSQNFMKNTEANDEPIYQPPNKIIKYDVEVISAESCNSDENSTRSIKNINTTKHANKKIKLDKNIIFQKDIDDSERDCKSLNNEEVKMLLELPYNFDDKIVFDDEDNTHIKIHDGQTNEDLSESMRDSKNILEPIDNYCMNFESLSSQEKICFASPHDDASTKSIPNKKLIELRGDSEKISDSDKTTDKMYIDSVNIPDLAGTQNTSIKHLFNESVLDDMKIDISTEDNSMSQCNDCSENSINQSEKFVNVGDVLVLVSEMCDDDVDNCNDPESIDQDGIVDLTNCENDEMMLNHENCTSIINKGLNSTTLFDYVNSEIQTYCEETTHCSDNTIHITDFESIIVPEGKLNDSTKHVDDQEYVCKTQSNQEKNNFESSNLEDDLFGDDILDVHSKVDYCENNLNQQSLLDTDANNHTILENKNSTSEINPGQKNESTLQRLTVQEEEMLTKLFNNDVDELGIVTDCTDNSLLEVNKCEANASKISERKRHFTNDEALIMPVDVSEDVNYNGLSHNCGMEVTLSKMNPDQRNKSTLKTNAVEEEKMLTKLVNKEDDELRIVTVCTDKITTAQTYENVSKKFKNQDDLLEATLHISDENASITCEEESCRDVSVHTIHSLDGYEVNCSKNNDTVPSMENNDSLVPLNNALENSTVEICNGEIETLLGMKNKNDNYEEEIIEGIIKQIIEDITVSLDSSNTFHHVLKNIRANDFENILAPVDESNMNSESLTAKDKMGFGSYSNTNSLNKLPRTGSETYEYNHNIDASTKSIPNKKLIELRGDSEKISDSDKTTDKIIDSVNIPDLAGTQNTSIKHLFNESVLDDMKIDISTEDNSMSQCNDCSENSINQSEEFVNVGDVLVLMSEMCDDDVDNCNDPESIDQDGIVDLTNCENDEMMLNHENCTSIINKGLNSTMPFDDVNSEIQTYCEETTHCSDNTIHITDFERIIVPEGKLNDSTKHVDDQEYVCKTQSNQEKNNFESSNIEDDLFGDDILEVHSKVDYCENNLNQQSLLDTDANNHTILENKNSTSEINPGQKNESTLQRLTVQEEEMLTQLFNNDVDELGIVTDCTDNSLVEVNKCEANASKISERKRHFTNDETLIMPVDVSEDVNYNGLSHNCGMEVTLSKMNPDQRNKSTLKTNAVEEEKMLTKLVNKEDDELRIVTVCTDKITTAQTCEDYIFEKNVINDEVSEDLNSNSAIDATTVINYDVALSERNFQGSVTGDQFMFNTFYFGTENCRDVSVHTIHSLDGYEMNCSKNNDTVPSMENNDSLVPLNNALENSTVEICNGEIETLLGMKNKNDNYEEEIIEGIIKQIIEDITVSLDSSNTFHHVLKNMRANDFENILAPVDESNMNSESLTAKDKMGFGSYSNTNSLNKLPRTGSETYEYNHNIDASTKSIPNKKLIELRGDSEKISDSDKTTDKIIDSVNIPDLAGTQNTSIKHLFNESVLDDMKIDISTEDNSMSQCNDCSENSINQSEEFVNVGDVLVLMSEMCDDDVDNCNDPESIDQDGIVDLTNCENDEMMLNHKNCTSIINKGLNSTMPFDDVNSEIQTYCEETTHCSDNTIHITDFESIIVPEGKLNDSTKHVDDQEYVCKTQSNQEKNNFESSNLEDDLFGDDILDVHSKVDYCENNLNQQSLLDTDANNHTILENKNSTSEINPGQKNESTLQRLTVQEEEMLTKLFNNDVDELGIVTDCTDNSLVEVNKCEANASKISERKRHFTNDEALIMPVDVSEDVNYNGLSHNCGMEVTLSKMNPDQRNKSTLKTNAVEEEKMLTKLVNKEDDELRIVTVCTDKITTAQTYENVSKKFKNQDDLLEATLHISDENASITCEEERHLSFISSDARQILESSNDSEHLDDSLLFKPSDRDLVRYGIECGEYEKSISQSLNNLENNASNKEVISQCKSPSLRFNEISKSINNLLSSSYAKDYEDNVIDFYDCDLSSIENSDIEDNLLLSFENDSSIDDCIFNEKKEKLKHTTNSTSNEHICKNSLKIQNVGSPSESCNNSTNVLETPVSLINLPSHDHQYNKIMSTSMSIKQIGMNPDANDKFESFNHSDVKITTCNTIPSFYESDNINKIESDDLCKDQGELKCNSNDDQNLEVSNENHNQNNKNKSISEYNTHQNIEKSQNPYKDNGSENAKLSSMKNTENEEIPNINTVPSTSSDTNQSLIEKKKYLEEIINNEQLFNKFDEKLDINESTISPYISQSLVKSTNLKNALAKRAAANINIHEMGIKALSTYLTQQTMTLDVLKVLHKSLETFPSSGVFMEDPDGLLVPLMPHQKHAIAWLIWRESQEPRGGILADDMGLGKTLSMISLILKLKEKPQDSLLPLELTISIDNRGNEVIIGGTLVVCPASLINQWETEVKSKLKPGLLKVGQYYGIHRNFSALELAENDLVITSYNVVMWDHKLRQNTSPLYKIKWDRVILDEGHNIRNHKTQTSVAVCNIKSLNRWAITGTPIHNKEADFFTLLKFVQCKPFDDWPVWKRWVGNNDDAGKHRLSLLVKTLMLRRTKTELTQFTTFNLPTKKIITIEIELSKAERNAYERLLQFSSNLFATYLYDRAAKEKLFDPNIKVQRKIQYFQEQSQDKEDVFKDHLELLELFKKFKNINEIQTYHILVLLLRLRQMCCHPILIKGPITEDSIKKEDNMESILEDDTDATYNDLNNENKDIDTSPNNIDLPDNMSCLILADEPVEIKSVIDRNIFQKTYVSSKIKKICDLVNQKLLINGGNDKAIIVSQWPSFLYLIQKNLAHYNAKIEMFSGAIPIPRRNKIIRDFNNPDGGPRILLLSLKAGGVGLNLMAANHMFLIDVHWNPQLEAQACDRVHRVGQTKPVYIYKFISNNTIETRILNIQTLKLQIAENLFKGTSVASSKLTIDDLKQIFQFH